MRLSWSSVHFNDTTTHGFWCGTCWNTEQIFRSSVNWELNRDTNNESKSSYQFAYLYHSYKTTFLQNSLSLLKLFKSCVPWMDLETVIYSEVSQKQKNRYHILTHLCGTQNYGRDDLVCREAIETQMSRTNVWIQRRAGEGGMNWEIGIDLYTPLILYIKQITNENLLYSIGNSAQCSVVT